MTHLGILVGALSPAIAFYRDIRRQTNARLLRPAASVGNGRETDAIASRL